MLSQSLLLLPLLLGLLPLLLQQDLLSGGLVVALVSVDIVSNLLLIILGRQPLEELCVVLQGLGVELELLVGLVDYQVLHVLDVSILVSLEAVDGVLLEGGELRGLLSAALALGLGEGLLVLLVLYVEVGRNGGEQALVTVVLELGLRYRLV